MSLLLECGCLDTIAVILTIAVCILMYFKISFTYWKKRKIPYLEPHIPLGTLDNFIFNRKSFGEVILRQYFKAKQDGNKLIGLFVFTSPLVMFVDPLLIKDIMSTNFKHFMDRGVYFNEVDDPLSAHLFAIEGVKWRNLRAKLTPTFTSGKMKMMFKILTECGEQLKTVMDTFCTTTNEPVDIKDILARFTTNIIGSAAFGIECNAFASADSEFRKYGKKIFQSSKIKALKDVIAFVNRDLARRLGITVTPSDASSFFMNVVRETVEYREKNGIERNDFMQLLINLKNGVHLHGNLTDELEFKHDGKSLTLEELAAQAFVFFVAGFETSSTTMTFCLFELAVNPDIQDKVRREIEEVLRKHGGQITYDAVHEMKYTGQVIEETLRKYPPLPVLSRICTEDYKIPGTDIVIEKGTPAFIPIIGLHHDTEYFPDPEKFDPDRFSDENRHNILPYTYLPFGEGPRICIGLRFGLLQTKVGLAVLLQNFRFSLNMKTKMPLKMDPASFVLTTFGDMWLNVERV